MLFTLRAFRFSLFKIRKPITGERKKRNILQGVFQIFLISGLPNNPAFAFPQKKPKVVERRPARAADDAV